MAEVNAVDLDDAAATAAEVVQQVLDSVTANEIEGESGLDAVATTPPDSAEVVDDTVLTAAEENSMTSALTRYVDVQKTHDVVYPLHGLKIADPAFVFPRGYFDVVERSIRICTIRPPLIEPTGLPFVRIDIANALLSRDYIRSKFSYPVYIRYNLEVQVRLLATNFHYGQLMVVWRPAYAPLMNCAWSASGDEILCRFGAGANTVVSAPTAYDYVWTASQLPHKVLPVTAGSTVTLACPWSINRQYAPTRDMMGVPWHPGFLDIYCLTPLLPADIDRIAVQVFGRFKDCVGLGYRAVASPCAKATEPRLISYEQINGITRFQTSASLPHKRWNVDYTDPPARLSFDNFKICMLMGLLVLRGRFVSILGMWCIM